LESVHAEVIQRGGRVFCRALAGDPNDLKSHTRTWILPDTELRAGVDYMLTPGAEVSFGEKGGNVVIVEFEEGGSGGIAQVMMGAMSQGASSAVRDRMSS
jgi:hypothetical protein